MKWILFVAALGYGGEKPKVVGVGCAPPDGNWEIVMLERMDGIQAPMIVVERGMRERVALPATATTKEIEAACLNVETGEVYQTVPTTSQRRFFLFRRQPVAPTTRGGNC